jgi:hypothetical protein
MHDLGKVSVFLWVFERDQIHAALSTEVPSVEPVPVLQDKTNSSQQSTVTLGFFERGGMTERQCTLDVIKLSSWLYISLCMTGLPVERCMAVFPPPLQCKC